MIDLTVELTPESSDTDRVLRALLSDRWLDSPLRRIAQRLSAAERSHYLDVAKSTPYSKGYYGKKKPSGQVVVGGRGDFGYGIDTLRMIDDLSRPIIREKSIILDTDAPYADFQESLLSDRGKSFMLDDDEALDIASIVLLEALDRL